jgi:hypothetical protein
MWCFFESLRTLPLATAIAICLVAPLLMTAYSVVLLREHVGIHRWAAVGIGFAGVGLIIGPEAAGGFVSAGALLALGAASLYALGMTMVRWLAPTESDMTMIVMQCLVQMGVGLTGMALLPGTLGPMPDKVWIGIAAMSAFLILGQFLSYRAFRLAPVGAIAPFNYTELVWAAIIGCSVTIALSCSRSSCMGRPAPRSFCAGLGSAGVWLAALTLPAPGGSASCCCISSASASSLAALATAGFATSDFTAGRSRPKKRISTNSPPSSCLPMSQAQGCSQIGGVGSGSGASGAMKVAGDSVTVSPRAASKPTASFTS